MLVISGNDTSGQPGYLTVQKSGTRGPGEVVLRLYEADPGSGEFEGLKEARPLGEIVLSGADLTELKRNL